MAIPNGFEVFISLPVIFEHLTDPADQTHLCAACPEILWPQWAWCWVGTRASRRCRIYTVGASHLCSHTARPMRPMDPMQACLLEVLSMGGLPSMVPTLLCQEKSLTETRKPHGNAVPLGLCASFSLWIYHGRSWSWITVFLGWFGVCTALSTTGPAKVPRRYK